MARYLVGNEEEANLIFTTFFLEKNCQNKYKIQIIKG